MSTPVRNLADRVDSFPDPWLHEPGDKLIGEVLELATADKGFGPYSMLTVLVAESGSTEQGGKAIPAGSERVWHAFGTVPENELKKLTPRVGDLIAAKYFGVRDGTDYKAYRIIVEPKAPRGASDVVLDAAAEAGDEADPGETPVEEDDGIPY